MSSFKMTGNGPVEISGENPSPDVQRLIASIQAGYPGLNIGVTRKGPSVTGP